MKSRLTPQDHARLKDAAKISAGIAARTDALIADLQTARRPADGPAPNSITAAQLEKAVGDAVTLHIAATSAQAVATAASELSQSISSTSRDRTLNELIGEAKDRRWTMPAA